MKTITPKTIVSLFLTISVLLFFTDCSKSNDSQATNDFIWSTGGKSYNATIHKAFTGTGYTFTPFHIIAGFGNFPTGFNRRIDFHLSSFAVGSYTIVPSPNTVNTLQYIDDLGNNMEGIAGTLKITVNSNNLLSGDFSVTLIDASMVTSTMSGSFTNISMEP
jgi:hypothetical protein